MEINVTARHLDLTGPMEEYARGKVEKLVKYYDRISEIEVVVDQPNRLFEVEILISVDRRDPFIAKTEGDDYYACVDAAVDKATRQLHDYKELLRNRKHQQ